MLSLSHDLFMEFIIILPIIKLYANNLPTFYDVILMYTELFDWFLMNIYPLFFLLILF